MKFGKTESPNIDTFSWPNPLRENPIFEKAKSFEAYIGGTVFGVKEWKGKWFPDKTPQKNFLDYYINLFSCIELNATHYKIYSPSHIAQWQKKAEGKNFRFCPKFPQIISHYRRFNNCSGPTDDFIEGIFEFKENLGPCFIQLPPNFTFSKANELFGYLSNLPKDLKVSVEPRHESWFSAENSQLSFYENIQKEGIGLVICDTALRRDALHLMYTSDFSIVRFGGYFGSTHEQKRINDWLHTALNWKKNGLSSMYFFIHQENSVLTPESCVQWSNLFSEKGINLKKPKPIQLQGSLF
jgi:uncharacterized protein YecE (DUF72 family)